jgi:hypothetical protein
MEMRSAKASAAAVAWFSACANAMVHFATLAKMACSRLRLTARTTTVHMLIKAARYTMMFQAVARYTLHISGLLHELLKLTPDPMLLQAVARYTLHISGLLHELLKLTPDPMLLQTVAR